MKRLLLATLLVAFTSQAKAERGPTVEWLQNEPVTLFDFGMFQLGEAVSNKIDKILTEDIRSTSSGWTVTGVNYDQDKNRIKISLGDMDEPFEKKKCSKILKKSRSIIGQIKDGKSFLGKSSIIANMFVPSDNKSRKVPEGIKFQLDQIIVINVSLDGGSCHGPLVSEDVYFKEAK